MDKNNRVSFLKKRKRTQVSAKFSQVRRDVGQIPKRLQEITAKK